MDIKKLFLNEDNEYVIISLDELTQRLQPHQKKWYFTCNRVFKAYKLLHDYYNLEVGKKVDIKYLLNYMGWVTMAFEYSNPMKTHIIE